MVRDARRDAGQWRGCHTFKDIVCDGDRPGTSRRDGGLKMGQPYYFYYEVDGSYETHDTSLPSTSTCPYLPGQTVNVMTVPAEVSDRQRSASLGSLNYETFMTMDPGDRYSAPRRAPPPPAIPDFLGPRYRLPTAPVPSLKHQRSDRSLASGGPNWWSPRKLFTRKQSTCSVQSDVASASETSLPAERSSSAELSSGSMSPESLRRFLCDDTPVSSDAESAERLSLSIPDDIIEEDDDDEFVMPSAVSEFGPKTILSPPPPASRHVNSSHTMRRLPGDESAITLNAIQQQAQPQMRSRIMQSYTFYQPPTSQADDGETPTSRFSFSSDEGSVFGDDEVDPLDTSANMNEIPSFYYSDAEDDDEPDCLSPPINFVPKRAGFNMARDTMEQSLAQAFEGYRLPRTSIDASNKLAVAANQAGEASVLSSPPLLALPVMDDFVSEVKSAGLF